LCGRVRSPSRGMPANISWRFPVAGSDSLPARSGNIRRRRPPLAALKMPFQSATPSPKRTEDPLPGSGDHSFKCNDRIRPGLPLIQATGSDPVYRHVLTSSCSMIDSFVSLARISIGRTLANRAKSARFALSHSRDDGGASVTFPMSRRLVPELHS
jgi:hypothetical protein